MITCEVQMTQFSIQCEELCKENKWRLEALENNIYIYHFYTGSNVRIHEENNNLESLDEQKISGKW